MSKSRRFACAVTVIVLLSPVSAAVATPLPDSSVACRQTIARQYRKLIKTALKSIADCHRTRNRDASLAGMDCNATGVADTDARFVSAVARDCSGGAPWLLQPDGVDPDQEDHYVSCPVSCPGVPNGIETMAQVADCLVCTAGALTGDVGAATLGLPAVLPLSSRDAKCHAAIVKGYGKYLLAGLRAETVCQGDDDEAGDNTLAGCYDDDPDDRVSAALDKARERVDSSCAAADLANIDGCASDLVALAACNESAWSTVEDDLFTSAYDMPPDICPTAVRMTIRGGCTASGTGAGACSSGFETPTQLSVGWKGPGHGMDVPDSFTLAADISCGGSPGNCGDCSIAGVSSDNPQHGDFTRCKDDPSQRCSVPFGVDPANCPLGTQKCEQYLGPPLVTNASGTPLCTMNVLGSDLSGSIDPDAGSAQILVELRSVVHSGISQQHPCPICRGDETPQDGARDGLCFGGSRDGDPCDVQAFDLSFAPVGDLDNPDAGSSLDCPPLPGANASGGGLVVTLPLTTATASMDAQDSCESPNGSLDCFCGACSLDSGHSCQTDTDCSSLGKGSCGAGAGVARKPNNCTDGICEALPGLADRGECSGGHCVDGATPGADCARALDCPGGSCSLPDDDSYCDGLLRANGAGILACGVDTDCDAYVTGSSDPDNWVCPGDDCGDCDASFNRSCFLDPFSLSGEVDPDNPVLVATFCVPPLSSAGKSAATGLPGPADLKAELIVEKRF